MLLLLMVAMMSGHLCAQNQTTLYNNDTTYFCTNSAVYINHLNFSYNAHLDAFDSWGVITGVDSTFSLTIEFITANVNGFLDIWDGDENAGTLILNHATNYTNQTLPIGSEQITFHIHFDAISPTVINPIRQLNLSWISSVPPSYPPPLPSDPCGQIYSIQARNITTTTADIKWQPTSITMDITIDGQHYTGTGGTLNLTGLSPNTLYHVRALPHDSDLQRCCSKVFDFQTQPIPYTGCPDVLDLYSTYVQCLCGFNNNNLSFFPNIMDGGPNDSYSRHTVHNNPNETDPNTGNLLHTVGPGDPGSVRLGNWHSGGEVEAIVYHLHVDTTLYSLIMLHYAAVLQNPNHTPEYQPRFTMRILDQNDNVIDPQCGAADFVADTSLGWNTYNDILWKDWTTIGINLAPYHGQNVQLQFTTYDCKAGGHFGYAYFYVECQQPYASSDHCGTVDTATLTAPAGFNYLWYYGNNTQNPISTDQSATVVTSEGPVHCRLSFIEKPSCYLTMNTDVFNFWPHAEVDTLQTTDNGCDGYVVRFRNRSTILDDDSIPLPGYPPCESAIWSFGDGTMSIEYHPTHTYQHPGTYTVTLISSLANGQCSDTTTYTIVAPDAWAPKDLYLTCCDSLLWIDSVWYDHDTVGPTKRVAFPATCDTIYTLHLSTLPSAHFTLPADTFCYNSNYTWRGHSAPISHSADTLFPMLIDTLVAANGCDSVVYLPLVQLPPDPLSIDIDPDCGMGYYLLTAATDNPFWLWSSSPHDTALVDHETDRQIWVFPDSTVTYILTSYYGDSLFCPTAISHDLSRPTFPHAELEVNPEVLSVDNPTLIAYDKSERIKSRRWAVIPYGTGDTIVLPDTLRRISYTASLFDDSITVILAVSNAFCLDTATRTLPIVRSAVFAPNIFTPDQTINNRFTIVCNGMLEAELTIYNRHGLLVFTTTDLDAGWDGTHNGTPCPQGAYVWHLRYRTFDRPDGWRETLGTVTLLR